MERLGMNSENLSQENIYIYLNWFLCIICWVQWVRWSLRNLVEWDQNLYCIPVKSPFTMEKYLRNRLPLRESNESVEEWSDEVRMNCHSTIIK